MTVQAAKTTHDEQPIIGVITITKTCLLRENVNGDISANPITAYEGDVAYIIATESGWYNVNYNMRNGYLHEDTAKLTPYVTNNLGKWVITANADLYTNPDAGQKANITMNAGEKVEVTGYSRGWFSITDDDTNGYIRQENLSPCEKPKDNRGKTITAGDTITAYAMNYLGCPYVWGGTTTSGFDCSGFVWRVFTDNGYDISRTADNQYEDGTLIKEKDLEKGDVVFFERTYQVAGITHCGIYIGDGEFIHAASSQSGVRIDSLSTEYYAARYVGACRIEKQKP